MANLINSLIVKNLITSEQLKDAQDKQLGAKRPILDLLVEMEFIKEDDLMKVAQEVYQMQSVNLTADSIDPAAIKLIPYDFAKRMGIFPVKIVDDVLIFATSDPKDIVVLDDLKVIAGMNVQAVLAKKSMINEAIEKYYQLSDNLYDLLKNISDNSKIQILHTRDLETIGPDFAKDVSPVIRLVNLILADAIKSRASDVHIEPQEETLDVRYRIDGDLKNIFKADKQLQAGLIARIKILGELDIAETRKPQDGRTTFIYNDRKIDLRISTIPTYHGEKIVLRILDPSQAKVTLDQIGMEEDSEFFKEALVAPQGIVLVTGPTGSGKTSTLYAALNYVKHGKKNIITIEDPVEYLMDGVNQIQVNPTKDMTFANGLRSILRQDPNVILVGEIRDAETAEIAFRGSLTGHLVLSTLHTNSAIATIARLLDIGLEPYLIASSLNLVLTQRLVKVICPNCKQEIIADEKLKQKFKVYLDKYEISQFYNGAGCQKCDFTGYFGRTAIFELLKVNEKIKNLIASKSSEEVILKEAVGFGLEFLAESGIKKVKKGITTLEEVNRVAEVMDIVVEAQIIQDEKDGKPRILIVDDEIDIVKILEKRLMNQGFKTFKAGNGKEAIEAVKKEKPDLIILDVMMPVMDGFETLGVLRSKLDTAGIPVIMLTAKSDKDSEIRGLEIGADDYITKPFDFEKVLARIKMLLKRRG